MPTSRSIHCVTCLRHFEVFQSHVAMKKNGDPVFKNCSDIMECKAEIYILKHFSGSTHMMNNEQN